MQDLFKTVTDKKTKDVIFKNALLICSNRKFKVSSFEETKRISFLDGGIIIEYNISTKEISYFTCSEDEIHLLTIYLPILKVGEFGKFATMLVNDPIMLLSITSDFEVSKFGED